MYSTYIQWVQGDLTPGGKQLVHEADHSSHPWPRLRISEAIPPLPEHIFMAWCLVMHRDNFTFTLQHFHFLKRSFHMV